MSVPLRVTTKQYHVAHSFITKQNSKIPQTRLGENKIKNLCKNLKILIKELILTILHSYLMLCRMAQSDLSMK